MNLSKVFNLTAFNPFGTWTKIFTHLKSLKRAFYFIFISENKNWSRFLNLTHLFSNKKDVVIIYRFTLRWVPHYTHSSIITKTSRIDLICLNLLRKFILTGFCNFITGFCKEITRVYLYTNYSYLSMKNLKRLRLMIIKQGLIIC